MEESEVPVFLYEKSCQVIEPSGLFAVPVISILREVARSAGSAGIQKIYIRRADNGKVADPFSVMDLLMLSADFGIKLVVYTSEPSLVDKVDSLADFIDKLTAQTTVDFSDEDLSRVIREFTDRK